MAGRARRRGPGGAVAAILASVAVAALVTVLATHRDAAEANPNSAVIATVPPLAGASAPDVSVTGLPAPADAGASGPDLGWLDDGDAPTAAWPTPPADPAPAVDAAIARAADDGVRVAAVVVDRSSGRVLVSRDADVSYPALSLLKIMIAADVLTDGWPDPAHLDAVLTPMIATSDDAVAGDLYDAAGGDDLVNRVALRYGLTGTTPTPDGTYWGNVQVTAADMTTLLAGVLADPRTAPVIGPAMRASTAIAADGVDQRFGMRLVPGAGSKQGWGCCLSGEVGLHSIGFTDDRIVVVLTGAEPDDADLGNQDGPALQADPGAQAGFAAVDATVRAALGGPAG
ncbi:MAG TPA: hypothetical protein VIC62_08090 [Nakamurella sp.]